MLITHTASSLILVLVLSGLSLGASTTVSADDASPAVKNTHEGKVDSVDALTNGLKARLDKNPHDVKGWVLLAKSYQYLQRWDDANAAYEKAKSLGYDGPAISAKNTNAAKPKHHYKHYSPHKNMSNAMAQGITEAIGKAPVSSGKHGINVRIEIAPELLKTFSPKNSVFIFVRSADKAGPPLAALRKNISELPFTVLLDDSMSMMPGRNISSATKVVVGARISMTGYATKSAGDIEVLSKVVASDYPDTIELVLSKKPSVQ